MMARMAERLRAVLFDAVGTLIEAAEPLAETYARAARARGVDLPAERLDEAFRRIHRRAPPMAFPDARPEEVPELERAWWRDRVRETFRAADAAVRFSDFDDFEAYFAELFDAFGKPTAWRARPGAAETLAALRLGGLATGVVSNFDHRLTKILQAMGLAKLLDVVILPGHARTQKPDGRIFRAALEKLGVPPGGAVFVGDDRERDLDGARAAGLAAVDVGSLANLAELPARLRAPAAGP